MADRWLLVLNAGSSSLKYELFDADERALARGEVDRIGGERSYHALAVGDEAPRRSECACPDHRAAVDWALRELDAALPAHWRDRVVAAGHRVVHRCPPLLHPTRAADHVVAEIARQSDLAP